MKGMENMRLPSFEKSYVLLDVRKTHVYELKHGLLNSYVFHPLNVRLTCGISCVSNNARFKHVALYTV